jgi:hypothetical protein
MWAEEIADARLVADGYRHDAVLWRAEADLLPEGSVEREQAERDIANVEQLATEYARGLSSWWPSTPPAGEWTERAEAARLRDQLVGDELQRRGLRRDVQTVAGEQADLFEVVERTEAGTGSPRCGDPPHLGLADLGAEIIKIEDPRVGGDVDRYVPPYAHGEDSLFFETFNRNKRSLSVALSTRAGRAVFEDLVRASDAVYSNLRGDVPAKMRIRYDDLKHLNPAIAAAA